MIDFDNKVILVTGGTGTFGSAVSERLLRDYSCNIRIFSRDEKKQDDMRKRMNNPNLSFFIGDVRDNSSLITAVKGVDYIFHAAALKQVPSCDFFPMQAVYTNILGTNNIINAAISNSVKSLVLLSTDKAVYPINAMGMSKALMEKVGLAGSRNSGKTCISITRYGNVMASRGSVIPLFYKQIREGIPLTITDPQMTRFLMSIDEAVDLVLHALSQNESGSLYVRKSPSATIDTIARAVMRLFDLDQYPISYIGTRHGEKLFETLLSREEMSKAVLNENFYHISPDTRTLDYEPYYTLGASAISNAFDFNSHNSVRLNIDETYDLITRIDPRSLEC